MNPAVFLNGTPRIRITVLAAFALLAPLPGFLGASFTSPEDRVLSARAAGASGAWEAGPRSLDNALMNPAGLPSRQGSDLMFSGGTSGRRGRGLGSAVLSWPVDEILSLAASYHALLPDSAGAYTENTAALSAAFEINRWLSAGGRYNFHQISTGGPAGGASGGSLDFGVRGRMGLNARHGLIFAGGVRNAASFWAERNWARAMPVDLKAGLGWAWSGSTWSGMEFSRILPSTAAIEASSLFRLGGEHQFENGISARAGFSSDADQRWSLGGGWEHHGSGLRAHYALLVADAGSISHRLQMEWGFAAGGQPTVSVAPLEIRYEEGSKRVKEAKFAVNIAEDQKAEAWQLEIRDKDGKLIRVIEGTGTPPGYVSWDGRDKSGAWVDDGDQVSYKLSIKTPDGEASSRPLLAGDMTAGGSSLSALSIQGVQQNSLPSLLPVFGEDGKEVDHFMIKMPTADAPTSKWKVLLKDSSGNVIQAIEGTGVLPSEFSWDGKNKEGMKIQDTSGLTISLVMADMSGKESEIPGTVYSQAGQALDWGEDKETRLALRIAPLSPGGRSFEMTMSDITLKPLAIAVPTKPQPLEHTPVAASALTPEPTPAPAAPYQVLSPTQRIHIQSQFGAGRTAFAFMPRPTATPGPQAPEPLNPGMQKRLSLALTPFVLDIFELNSGVEAKKFEARLNAAWERIHGLGFKQIRLTGLVKFGELDGAGLSRARAMRLSELLSQKGFNGEFVIWVQGQPGGQKGVKIEVLR